MTEPILPAHSRPDVVAMAMELWEDGLRRRAGQRGQPRQRLPRQGQPRGLTIRDLPLSERPRERLASLGPQALSEVELLACILGRGGPGQSVVVTAQRILSQFGSLTRMAHATVEELGRIPGVGLAKAAALKAACELSRRAELGPTPTAGEGQPLETIQAASRAARRHLAGRREERFIILLLDSRHRILRTAEVSVGSLDMSIVHPRETFREAIAASAAAVILAHNHPSGDPTPSREDLELTRRLVHAGRLLGIPVLDHLIVGRDGVLSFRARGFFPEE